MSKISREKEKEGRVYDKSVEGRKTSEAVIRNEPHTELSDPSVVDRNIEKRKLPEDTVRRA